jgi:ABC-2 type transport system ATP-binding protein
MRQRLGLALALLNKPKLLILDEPTNGLDPAGIHEMRDLIRRLPEEFGATVFLSSHMLSEVEQLATHIGIIHQGRLLFQGKLAELQAQRQDHLTIGVKGLERVEQIDKAIRCLNAAGWIAQAQNDGLLIVPTASRDAAAQINSLLVNHDFEVFHIALAQASLEDIFLTLTNGRGEAGRAA